MQLSAKVFTLLSAGILSFALDTSAQEDRGLATGSKAPGFNLKDPSGTGHSLDEILKKGNVALMFHRSADW